MGKGFIDFIINTGHLTDDHLLALDCLWAIAIGNFLGQALSHSGLAHSWLANQARVVLCPPAQNLCDTLDLLLTSYHSLKLALHPVVQQLAAWCTAIRLQQFLQVRCRKALTAAKAGNLQMMQAMALQSRNNSHIRHSRAHHSHDKQSVTFLNILGEHVGPPCELMGGWCTNDQTQGEAFARDETNLFMRIPLQHPMLRMISQSTDQTLLS